MLRKTTLAALALTLAPLMAQGTTNSTLALTYDATAQELTANLSGAPADAFTWVAAGETLGSTTFRRSGLTIDLDRPFRFIPLGRTDANGDLSRVYTRFPSRVMAGTTLNFQAVTVEVTRTPRMGRRRPTRTFTFTTSNVATQAF